MKIYIKTDHCSNLLKRIDTELDKLPILKEKRLNEFYEKYKTIEVGIFTKKYKELPKEEFNNYLGTDICSFDIICKHMMIEENINEMNRILTKMKKGILFANNFAEFIELSDDEIIALEKCESWNI